MGKLFNLLSQVLLRQKPHLYRPLLGKFLLSLLVQSLLLFGLVGVLAQKQLSQNFKEVSILSASSVH